MRQLNLSRNSCRALRRNRDALERPLTFPRWSEACSVQALLKLPLERFNHLGLIRNIWAKLDASVRARVFIPCAVLFAVTLAAMVLASVELLGKDLEVAAHQRAQLFIHVAADGLTAAMIHSGPDALPGLLTVVNDHREEIISVSLLRENGAVISSSDRELLEKFPWSELPARDRTTVVPIDGNQFAVVRPIENEPRCARCHGPVSKLNGWLDARFSREPVTAAKRLLAGKLATAAVPSLIALLAIAWWLLGREVVNPLQRLVRAMQRAAAGESPLVADEGRTDEVGVAARGFDATLSALHRSTRELENVYAERMVRADRFAAVGEMATGLAHEIRNPLAGLSGALELLAEDLASSPPQAEVVKEMRHQVTRLTQTMEGLLRFARPPRARMRTMDVNAVLENVLFLVRQQRTKGTVHVERRSDPLLPPVYGDPALLEQVFVNVCLNACQAMNAAGGTLRVNSVVRNQRVLIEIADSGPGIPESVRPHIFTPFFTTRHDGNGLGLAISARIVVEHGGQIDFTCPPEGGTVFSVSLPIGSRLEQAA